MSIARHTVYNLVGTVVPIALALVTVPAYLRLIGPERYGILAIAWLILGYFGLFDLGLGRATTQRIAALRDAGLDQRAVAFGTALVANIGIGLVGGAILAPIAWYLFAHAMTMTAQLRAEALTAVPLLALSVPIATTMGVLSGALMGRERFLETNRIGIVSTSLFQLLPLAIAWAFAPNLLLLLGASLAARAIGLAMLWGSCAGEFGGGAFRRFDRAQLGALLGYGGWVTVTSVFGPFLVVLDRFVIGTVLNAVAVTVYTVPMQVTTRLGSLAGAVGNAMFPRLAIAEGAEAARLSRQGTAALLACLTAPVAAAYVWMQPALILWVGHTIGEQAAPIGRVLLVAAWLNTFAQVPYTRLEATGRPRTVALLMLAELPLYVPALYIAIRYDGLMGAALVYLLRVVVDLALLSWQGCGRIEHGRAIAGFCTLFAAMEGLLRWWRPGMSGTIVLGLIVGAATLLPCWRLLPPGPRELVLARLRRGRREAAA